MSLAALSKPAVNVRNALVSAVCLACIQSRSYIILTPHSSFSSEIGSCYRQAGIKPNNPPVLTSVC